MTINSALEYQAALILPHAAHLLAWTQSTIFAPTDIQVDGLRPAYGIVADEAGERASMPAGIRSKKVNHEGTKNTKKCTKALFYQPELTLTVALLPPPPGGEAGGWGREKHALA